MVAVQKGCFTIHSDEFVRVGLSRMMAVHQGSLAIYNAQVLDVAMLGIPER